MSGGSMQYLYSTLLHRADFPCDTPEREAFAKHLKLVAQALHDIEWVDSGDYGPGDETAAIKACLGEPLRKAARMALESIRRLTASEDMTYLRGSITLALVEAEDALEDALREALGGEG